MLYSVFRKYLNGQLIKYGIWQYVHVPNEYIYVDLA